MNYQNIYNSYFEDIKVIEKKYKLTKKGKEILKGIKSSLKQFADKIEDMKRFNEFKSKLEFYTTVDYATSFKDLRRKVLYKYGEICELGKEIEKLLYRLEKEKILKEK